MKPRDLTGQRFGKLTVLRESETPYVSPAGKKTRRWDCVCDCGREVTVLQNQLTSGQTQSCGCSRRMAEQIARGKGRDLAGQRFGRLTVIEPAALEKPEANGAKTGWRCRCDCGNEAVMPSRYLLCGKIHSCGCLLAEASAARVNRDVGHYAGTKISAIRPGRGPTKTNRSGVRGVFWSERDQRWIARIGVQGKEIRLGRFKTLEEAAVARKEAEERYYAPILEAYEKEK